LIRYPIAGTAPANRTARGEEVNARRNALLKASGALALVGLAWSIAGERPVIGGDKDTYGISVVIEPEDLEYYRSYLPPSLDMPERPLLAFFFLSVHLPLLRFMESGVLVLCERDGKPGWAEVGVYVENPIVYLQASTMMGSRKLFCERITLRPEGEGWHGEVRRFGKTAWSLGFTPRPIPEMGELEPWQLDGFEGRAFHPQITEPRYQVSKLRRKVSELDLGPVFPAQALKQTGMVRIGVDPACPWAGMVVDGGEHPGMFVKFDAKWDRMGK
jgi:hypothetical protein